MGIITDCNGEFIATDKSKNNIVICYCDGDILKFKDRISFCGYIKEAKDSEGTIYRVVDGFTGIDEVREFLENIDRFYEWLGAKRKFSISRSFKGNNTKIAEKLCKKAYKEKLNKDFTTGKFLQENMPPITDLKFYEMLEHYYFASFCFNKVQSHKIFENVYYRDFTQHYPSIMRERLMPVSAKRISKKSELPEHWFGLWEVDVNKLCMKNLPQKLQELIVFNNFQLVVTEMDIPVYEALGIEFLECKRLYEVKLAPLNKNLRDQIDFMFNTRRNAKAALKKEKEKGNEANPKALSYYTFLNNIFKWANERTYGNAAKKYFFTNVITLENYVISYNNYHNYFKDNCSDEYDDWFVDDWFGDNEVSNCSVWQLNEMKRLKKEKELHLPKLLAVYTVSYSRRDQYDIVNHILECGGRCLYTDTDSFFYQCDYDCLDNFRGKSDGDYDFLKLEAKFVKAKFPARKWWAGETETGEFKYASAGAVGLKDGTTVENFCKNQGIFPNLQIERIVKEEFI